MNILLSKFFSILLSATFFLPLVNGSLSPQASEALALSASALIWVDMPDMPNARYNMGVAATTDGKIYVMGGDNWSCTPLDNMEVFDPATNAWSILSPMPTPRWGVRSTALDGKIYAIGGNSDDCGEQIMGTVEVYDPATDTWETRTPMPTPRAAMGVASANGKIYAMGGIIEAGGVTSIVEEYDPFTDTWTQKADMPIMNYSFGIVAADNGIIYTFGGSMMMDAAFAYDTVTDDWTSVSPMPTPRDTFAATRGSNGNIFAVGGFSGSGPTGSVEEYNPQTDTWFVQTPIPSSRAGHGMAASGEVIYAIGGFGYDANGSALGALSSVVAATIIPMPPPPNDDFIDATIVSAGSLPFYEYSDLRGATLELSEPTPSCASSLGSTIWYSFTSEVTGYAYAYNPNWNYSFWALYTGEVLENLDERYCSSGGERPLVEIQQGQTYYFQVGSLYGDREWVDFRLDFYPKPPNDNFADATQIPTVPYYQAQESKAATREIGEKMPSCAFDSSGWTIWYAFTPTETKSFKAAPYSGTYNTYPFLAIWIGDSLAELSEVGCASYGGSLVSRLEAGVTYYFQIGVLFDGGAWLEFSLNESLQPIAGFSYSPWDPSLFDTISFWDTSYDPEGSGFSAYEWDFGDGTTSTEASPTHRYAADGDYVIWHKVTTIDGRTAETSQVVQVRTRDVTITKFSVPKSASSGQTRTITVSVKNVRYPETVEVRLYKNVSGNWIDIGMQIQSVAVRSNRTTDFMFSYTFTPGDAAVGKVVFKVVATIIDHRDALPADNEAISLPVKVSKC
jgi:N-acetylneuraminic acid mutarotase